MITSSDNPKLKHIRNLLTQKKARDEARQFVLENERFIRDALTTHPQTVDSLFFTSDCPTELIQLATTASIPTFEVSPSLFSTLHSVKTSFGLIAILNKPTHALPKTIQKALYLDGINKPQNLGAILRSAAAFSLDAVFVSPETCDPYHPESLRAMAGHCFTLPLIDMPYSQFVTHYPTLTHYILSEKASQPLQNTTFSLPCALLLGSETGFSDDLLNHPHPKTPLLIPIHPSVDSLNVAIAASIALWQLKIQ